MSAPISFRRMGIAVALVLIVGVIVAWQGGVLAMLFPRVPGNAILVIAPYRYNGAWVFDDPVANLTREPFVAGMPEMIDYLVTDIPNAEEGFLLTFSGNPFPGYQKKLAWLRGDRQGNWYRCEDPPMEGWLCPGLFKYFRDAPKEIYVKAEAKREKGEGKNEQKRLEK